MPRDVHPRPFSLYFGESASKPLDELTYSRRSRCSSINGALRAAVSRLHRIEGLNRVDVYDTIKYPMITIVRQQTGVISIFYSTYALKMHAKELRVEGVVYLY